MLHALADALEHGIDGRLARWAASLWEWTGGRSVTRTVAWPPACRAIAVGGATLGGTGKTPLAIACAAHLAAAGVRTALVGHAYRGSVDRARIVNGGEPVELVGDEALMAAAQLTGAARRYDGTRGAARVVVAPTRAEAVALAATLADVLVFDGVAQTSPKRASLALLAVDGRHPWGRAGAVPPRGDLRAPRSVLLPACDVVVPLVDSVEAGGTFRGGTEDGRSRTAVAASGPPWWPALVRSRGAWLRGRVAGASRGVADRESLARVCDRGPVDDGTRHRRGDPGGELVSWPRLGGLRLGLLVAVARPDRVVRFLALRGVHPHAVVAMADHGPFDVRARRAWRSAQAAHRIDLWLASPKCAYHVPEATFDAPLAVIDHSLVLAPELVRVLAHVVGATQIGSE